MSDELELSTFSIVARDPETGMFGVAVSTAVPGVGGLCPFAKAGVGAVATQAFVNVYLGIDGIRMLEDGLSAPEALVKLVDGDPGRAVRQLSIVDASGQAASHSGAECTPWFGHLVEDGVAVAGNMLVGEETISEMLRAYASAADEDLVERLMLALEAGQAAGGDFRGRQSAALKVVRDQEFPLCDLRVDEHSDPVAELRRVLGVARKQLLPFVESLPTRESAAGPTPTELRELLLLPPAERSP